jgi:imidazolonepropionase-like amidohydrolase
LGIEGRVGSIEAGKDADLVLWSGNPLELTTFADMTIIGGEIVYERGEA